MLPTLKVTRDKQGAGQMQSPVAIAFFMQRVDQLQYKCLHKV